MNALVLWSHRLLSQSQRHGKFQWILLDLKAPSLISDDDGRVKGSTKAREGLGRISAARDYLEIV